MTQEPQKSNAVLIVIAIIGVVGTIVASAIGVIGNYNIEKIRQEAELTKIALVSIATQGGATQASMASTISASTNTPLPTNTLRPTDTPQPIVIFTDTSVPQNISIDTDPNSTLPVGETWTTNGLNVQLPSVDFRFSDEMDINFIFINNTGKTLFFNFNESTQVILKDDKGNIYTWNNIYEQDVVLENGDTYSEQVYKGGNFSGAQYFIIELNIPGIITAKWRFN